MNMKSISYLLLTIFFINQVFFSFGVTVINTNDSGIGSLRAAMEEANMNGTSIDFDIPGTPPHRIILLSPLPALIEEDAQGTSIEGRSQPNNGYVGSGRKIIIDGNGIIGDGLEIAVSGCEISGVEIKNFKSLAGNFGNGIVFHENIDGDMIDQSIVQFCVISDNQRNGIKARMVMDLKIENNFIGTDSIGENDRGNALNGIRLEDSEGVDINNNVISKNRSSGIHIVNTGDVKIF